MSERMNTTDMLTRAGRAVGKVDRHGPRGLTFVSFAEIEAMAATLAAFGLPPLADEGAIEDPVFVSRRFHPHNFTPLETPVEQDINND